MTEPRLNTIVTLTAVNTRFHLCGLENKNVQKVNGPVSAEIDWFSHLAITFYEIPVGVFQCGSGITVASTSHFKQQFCRSAKKKDRFCRSTKKNA